MEHIHTPFAAWHTVDAGLLSMGKDVNGRAKICKADLRLTGVEV